jgi:hypothetical protein
MNSGAPISVLLPRELFDRFELRLTGTPTVKHLGELRRLFPDLADRSLRELVGLKPGTVLCVANRRQAHALLAQATEVGLPVALHGPL